MTQHHQARAFGFDMFRDFVVSPPEKTYFVQGVFADNEFTAVFGAPGDGKSVIIGDVVCHVAAGVPWFGRPVRRGAVLYVAAERAGLVKRRMAAWGRKNGFDDLPIAVMSVAPNLIGDEDARRIFDTVTRMAAEVEDEPIWIVVDTKARTMGGGDENSAKDMNAYVASCARIMSMTGCHVTVIDHVPHGDKGRMRGHGALVGAIDASFRVSKTGSQRLFEVDKINDGPDDVRLTFDLESFGLGTSEDGFELTAPVVVPVEGSASPQAHRPMQKLSDKQKLAIEALATSILNNGKPAPLSFGLPFETKVVTFTEWRDAMVMNDAIPPESKNPAQEFIRHRQALGRRKLVGLQNEHAWLVG